MEKIGNKKRTNYDLQENIEDTKGVIRSHTSKDRSTMAKRKRAK
jgi:hypothetical protein